MRAITGLQTLAFLALLAVAAGLAVAGAALIAGWLPASDYRGVIVAVAAVVLLYMAAMLVYRLFLWRWPLQVGDLAEGSAGEFIAQVHTLFHVVLFFSLIRTHFVPVPIMRLVYLALGARLGHNTYSGGALLDPALTSLGANCIVGHNAVIFAHAIEGRHFALEPVRIGHNVTIGAMAIVMSGVTIEDNAIVSAGAVVRKGTHIGRGEIWGGMPARRLGYCSGFEPKQSQAAG